ncbi:SDR family NAD(P)-dependent oxidoreductase [Aspergillus neoniger CBS 115656]|uniref:Short chain alcohol dehydrogenase n=1 Tax=Aspergillus neoniger (strain CBS 115656) TaxID=1448310 RepID=A0A318Y438_ASPNB|nr:short chain alcohol dehydrogenase [Aspergillus neoniger CBS 115656]PYH29046.1 short chain alcohol dehydrogenase [Aspergillus neoniger CBS 115656]
MTLTADYHSGKAYVLTGGCSGIGLAVLHYLLARSAIVHVLDISSIPPELPSHLSQKKKNLYFYPNTDVSSVTAVQKAFDQITTTTLTLHGLVNNAGIAYQPVAFGFESDDIFNRVMDVNVRGVWNVGKAFLSHILPSEADQQFNPATAREGRGVIVNLCSTASFHANSGYVTYTGVRVNGVAPGATDTPLIDGISIKMMQEEYTSQVPLGRRCAKPEEIADAVGFLLGKESSYMTGQVITVDGGRYI